MASEPGNGNGNGHTRQAVLRILGGILLVFAVAEVVLGYGSYHALPADPEGLNAVHEFGKYVITFILGTLSGVLLPKQ